MSCYEVEMVGSLFARVAPQCGAREVFVICLACKESVS